MRTREVMIIGAGKIGRGYLADVFTNEGFHLIFVNGKPDTIDKLNEAGKYTIFTTVDGVATSRLISGYEAYSSSRDFDKVVERLSQIDLACVALYPNAYESVADVIAGATKKRMQDGVKEPLNICMFVNYVFTGRLMKEKVNARLNDEEKAYFKDHIGIIDSLTRRNGSQPTDEMLAQDPLCISTGAGNILPVGDEFVGGRPSDIKAMQFVDKAEGRLVLKVWCGNVQHCTQANIGQFKGYTYIYESMADPYVQKMCAGIAQEACDVVQKMYDFSDEDMYSSRHRDYEAAIRNRVPDRLTRVAADPLRKLSRNERYIGPAMKCFEYGIVPYYLSRGAAYELIFHNDADASAVKMHQMIDELGVEEALWQISGLKKEVPHEKALHELIIKNYYEIIG